MDITLFECFTGAILFALGWIVGRMRRPRESPEAYFVSTDASGGSGWVSAVSASGGGGSGGEIVSVGGSGGGNRTRTP